MRRIATALLCALLLATTGVLAGPSPGGFPDMCTDVSNLETASNQGYVTCAEKKAGTSATYPGYLRVQDGNGTTLADVFSWSAATASTTVRGLATSGVVGFVAGNTWTQAVAGAGVVTAGTQRVTLASNDPAVASLAKNPWAKLDDDAVANCVAITDTTAQFTLPGSAGDWYCMDALDNTAYIKCGTNPTVDHVTVGTDWAFVVHEGIPKCRRLTGPKCAVIGTTSAGSICFEHLNPSL